jgi:hypothetical protein
MAADPRFLSGRAASRLALQLSARTSVTASRNNAEADAWRGAVDGTSGTVTLIRSGNGSISGTVQHDGRYYAIRPLGDHLHAIVELDQELMPPDHQPPLLLSRWDRSGQSNGVFALGSTFETRTGAGAAFNACWPGVERSNDRCDGCLHQKCSWLLQ